MKPHLCTSPFPIHTPSLSWKKSFIWVLNTWHWHNGMFSVHCKNLTVAADVKSTSHNTAFRCTEDAASYYSAIVSAISVVLKYIFLLQKDKYMHNVCDCSLLQYIEKMSDSVAMHFIHPVSALLILSFHHLSHSHVSIPLQKCTMGFQDEQIPHLSPHPIQQKSNYSNTDNG